MLCNLLQSGAHAMFFLAFSLLQNWPLSYRWIEMAKYQLTILLKWLYFFLVFFFVYNDGNSFSSIFMVCGNMDLLVLETRVQGISQGFNIFAKFSLSVNNLIIILLQIATWSFNVLTSPTKTKMNLVAN